MQGAQNGMCMSARHDTARHGTAGALNGTCELDVKTNQVHFL